MGVIMFVMLCGYPPFAGETDAEVLAKVRKGEFHFNPVDWKNVTQDAKDLIKDLLTMEPKKRISAAGALDHVWIKQQAPQAKGFVLPTGIIDNLRGFHSQNKLKKAALHVIAGQLNDEQIGNLRSLFEAMDSNQDGILTHAEMKSGLEKAGIDPIPKDLQAILEDVDSNNSGVIDYTEFIAAAMNLHDMNTEQVFWSAFAVFDKDGNGKIDKQELKQVLGNEEVTAGLQGKGVEDPEKMIQDILEDVDTDGDGEINFQEFLAMMGVAQGAKKAK